MQNSVNKYLIYFSLFIILSNCSISKKEDISKLKNKDILFKEIELINTEFNSDLKINIKKLTKGNPFLNNNTNNTGNINFDTEFKNKKTFKFKKINEFDFNQPELLFTQDNHIIFFDEKGSIFKINNKMNEKWKVNHYSKKEKKLNPILYFALKDNQLIVADTLSKIYSLDINSGALLWSKTSKSPFNSNIKTYKNKFMVVDYENVIRSFSINDGKEIWNFATENSFIKSQKKLSIIIKEKYLFFINNLGDITALNINDGNLIWQTPTQSNIIYQNAFSLENSDLVFAKNSIYFSNNRNEIFALDAQSGIVIWKQTISSSLRPVIIDNLVFSVSENGYILAIELNTGNIIRATNIFKNIKNKKNQIKPTGFIIAKSKAYISLNNGKLIKVNIIDGSIENIFKLAGSKILGPYVNNKNIYLLNENTIIQFN